MLQITERAQERAAFELTLQALQHQRGLNKNLEDRCMQLLSENMAMKQTLQMTEESLLVWASQDDNAELLSPALRKIFDLPTEGVKEAVAARLEAIRGSAEKPSSIPSRASTPQQRQS